MTDVHDIVGTTSRYERDDNVVILDSALRDTTRYPNPSNFASELDEPLTLVHGVDVLDAAIPASFYNVNETNNLISVILLTHDIPLEVRDLLTSSDLQILVNDNTRTRPSFMAIDNTYHRDIAFIFNLQITVDKSANEIISSYIDPLIFTPGIDLNTISVVQGIKLFDTNVMHVFIARETIYSTIRTEYYNHQVVGLNDMYIHFGDDVNYHPPIDSTGIHIHVRNRTIVWLEVYYVSYNRISAVQSPLGSRISLLTNNTTTIYGSIVDLLMPPGFYSADSFALMLPRATRDVLNATFDDPDILNRSRTIGNLTSKLTFVRGTGTGSENIANGFYPASNTIIPGNGIRGAPFILCQRKSTISPLVGMNYLPFLFSMYDPITGTYSATPTGVAAFNEMPYIIFRCTEVEEHMYRHGVHGRAGLGMIKLVAPNALNIARINFVNFIRRPFHPITIRRLTIRLEDSRGNLFDFNGGNNVITLRISRYSPSRTASIIANDRNGIPRSITNPDYDSDVLAYMTKRQNIEEQMSEEVMGIRTIDKKDDDIDFLVKEHNRRTKQISSELMHALLDLPVT